MSDMKNAPLIPTPPGFPVEWDEPGDARLFWVHDLTHYSDQLTPYDFFTVKDIFETVADKVNQAYHVPLKTFCRHFNTYFYSASVPQLGPIEEMIAQNKLCWEKLNAAMGNLWNRWESDWLPEVRQHLAYWEACDLKGASATKLSEYLNETDQRVRRTWEIHLLLSYPMVIAISLFEEMYRDLFGNAKPFEAYQLLVGFENKTVESAKALWKLSRQALASPKVCKVLTDYAPSEVIPKLSDFEEGRAFVKEIDSYLQMYGKRSNNEVLKNPFWAEDPSPVIKNLQNYITQPERDLTAELKKQAENRELRVAEVREQMQGYPKPVSSQFDFLLKAAQEGNRLREEHTHWIDFSVSYHQRQVVLTCGIRLAEAGVIDSKDDVFYLKPDEVRESMAALPKITDRRSVVKDRREKEKQFSAQPAPPVLGTPPAGPPPDDPILRAFFKVLGVPPVPSNIPGELKGSPGSGGTVRGKAKVVRSLADAGKLNSGDILVAEYTVASWTPLFASIAAVVTDSGGVLSHSSVVAREYGIPAVVGTGMATVVIKDGQTIEVNGDTGIVRVIE